MEASNEAFGSSTKIDLGRLALRMNIPGTDVNGWPLGSIVGSTVYVQLATGLIRQLVRTSDELSEEEMREVEASIAEIKSGQSKSFQSVDEALNWLDSEL